MRYSLLSLVFLVLASFTPITSIAQEEPPASPSPPSAAEPETSAPMLHSDGSSDWFENLLAREIETPPPPIEVSSADGFFRATVPARLLKPVEALEGETIYLLTFDLGVESSQGECYVYRDALDLAGSLALFSDNVFGFLSTRYGTIEAKAIRGIEAGGFDTIPHLELDWIFRAAGTETSGGAIAGRARHLVATKGGRSLYCSTTAPGYDNAFFDMFRSLVTTIEYGEEPLVEPYHELLYRLKVGEQTVGLMHASGRIDEDGDIEMREATALLLPVDQETLRAQDSYSLDYSDLEGNTLAEVEVEGEKDEIVTNLNLFRSEEGWIVTGVFTGKRLEADLGKADLRSGFGQALDFRRFMESAEPGDVFTTLEWLPDADPTRLQEVELTFRSRRGDDLDLSMKTESASFEIVADELLQLQSMSIPIGPTKMVFEKIAVRGDFLHPLTLLEPSEENEENEEDGEDGTSGSTSDSTSNDTSNR